MRIKLANFNSIKVQFKHQFFKFLGGDFVNFNSIKVQFKPKYKSEYTRFMKISIP